MSHFTFLFKYGNDSSSTEKKIGEQFSIKNRFDVADSTPDKFTEYILYWCDEDLHYNETILCVLDFSKIENKTNYISFVFNDVFKFITKTKNEHNCILHFDSDKNKINKDQKKLYEYLRDELDKYYENLSKDNNINFRKLNNIEDLRKLDGYEELDDDYVDDEYMEDELLRKMNPIFEKDYQKFVEERDILNFSDAVRAYSDFKNSKKLFPSEDEKRIENLVLKNFEKIFEKFKF